METTYTLKKVLLEETDKAFKVTEDLFRKIDNSELHWKPQTGNNWMTLGQLLMHCADGGCGKGFQGFIREDWGPAPEGEAKEEDVVHLPTAEQLPYVDTVDQAIRLLREDKDLTVSCINEAKESQFLQWT